MAKQFLIYSLLGLALLPWLSGCAGSKTLSGAGATFPAPFYIEVAKQYGDAEGIHVSYGGVGSGAGQRNLAETTVDFGGTDEFLSDEKIAKAMPMPIIHIPTCIGGIVIAYNLEGIEELRLTPEVISGIYTGRITEWNDPAIRELNPDITLPDQRVIPIYRTDGSGTTFVFSSYMSKVDSVWREELGAAKTLDIKVGNAAKGNPGVAGVISSTPGAIGYIGSEYSMALGIPAAAIRNRSGHFIAPTMESISLSANLSDFPDDTRVMIADSPDPDAYPISTMTWLIVYKEQSYGHRSLESARLLQDFLYYIVGEETHEAARKTHYASLPPLALEKARAVIASMTYQGKPLSEQ